LRGPSFAKDNLLSPDPESEASGKQMMVAMGVYLVKLPITGLLARVDVSWFWHSRSCSDSG
jgi:hypothetical protein